VAPLTPTGQDPAVVDASNVRVQARDGSLPSCSFCRGVCDGPDAGVTCAGCQAVYHPDCLGELGACATLGCPQPRAGARAVRQIKVPGVRCCHRPPAAGPIVLCDACGARWHSDCARGRRGACCAGHGFSPEQRLGRARQDGPRVGSERACTSCTATFTVEQKTRFSPLCLRCRRRWNKIGLLIVALGLLAQVLYFVVLVAAG
jgi:hypothetical protein